MEGPGQDATQLVWTWRSNELRHWPIINDGSWVSAVQQNIIAYYQNGSALPNTATTNPPYYNACVVMMVKDECDIVDLNLRLLYRTGFRRFVVADNKSSDNTLALLEEFRRYAWSAEVVIVQDHILRYTQSEKTTGLMLLASRYWSDCSWVFPIDADEILIAEKGLAVLDTVSEDTDVIVISKTIHGLTEHNERQASATYTWLEKMKSRNDLDTPPKVALRPRPGYIISQGNHWVTGENLVHAPGLNLGFHYREFPIRSFEQFMRKTINGGKAVHAANRYTKRAVGGNHWVRWYDAWLRGGEPELRKMFETFIGSDARTVDPLDLKLEDAGGAAAPPARPTVPNLALNKPADQSSISEWSLGSTTVEDASGAVDGNINGQMSFHTAFEINPWWQVDLEQICLVSEIWIHNRLDGVRQKERFQCFFIDVSVDSENWTRLYTGAEPQVVGGYDGYPFVFKTSVPVPARRVRITLMGENFLHLNEVEIFGVPKEMEAISGLGEDI